MENKPSWYILAFERKDHYQFKLGEMVKRKNKYYYIFDDNRAKTSRTYTYALVEVNVKEEYCQNDEEWNIRLYNFHPLDLEPVTEAEYILNHSNEVYNKYCNRFGFKNGKI